MWSFCIYCILHAKFPIPEITTPYAAMHQFPEKLNCLAIVQGFLTPPTIATVSRIKQDDHVHCAGIHVIWCLLIVVGASSAYFHATLSLLGQVSRAPYLLFIFIWVK